MTTLVTFDTIVTATLRRLDNIVETLDTHADSTANARLQLLATAFLGQMRDLRSAVRRIVNRLSDRALQRPLTQLSPLEAPAMPADHVLTNGPDDGAVDSTALTVWLIAELNEAGTLFQNLAGLRRLGPCAPAVNELAALFPAQSRRVAMEAHRFSDL